MGGHFQLPQQTEDNKLKKKNLNSEAIKKSRQPTVNPGTVNREPE